MRETALTIAPLSTPPLSAICQCLCYSRPRFPFARLLTEIDALVSMHFGQATQLTWCEDDHATLEISGLHLDLFWTDAPGQGLAGVLSLAARAMRPGPEPLARALLELVVAHLQGRIEIDHVIWRRLRGQIDANRIEALAHGLPQQKTPEFPGALSPRPLVKARVATL